MKINVKDLTIIIQYSFFHSGYTSKIVVIKFYVRSSSNSTNGTVYVHSSSLNLIFLRILYFVCANPKNLFYALSKLIMELYFDSLLRQIVVYNY